MFTWLLFASSALTEPMPVEVAFGDLVQRAEELHGRDIVIVGYIGQCGKTKCVLRMKYDGDDNRFLAMSKQSPAYDEVLANAAGKVRVTARFDATCVIGPCAGPVTNTLLVSKVERLEES